ncbi:ATP-binding protein [Candidatus Woesearchaeota archaeon]|nr:ATP-binding protein [Candidatus Woesearchaeota archaeon]
MIKGQIIGGEAGRICVRQKSNMPLELGELLIAEQPPKKILFHVFDLAFASQISQPNLELISGLQLEEQNNAGFFDENLRNYQLAFLKPLLTINENKGEMCKQLPSFFSVVRSPTKDDFLFLQRPAKPLFVGKIRSGSCALDVEVCLPARETISHHILVCATTGRGKSNLVKTLLWNAVGKSFCGMLVLDPHDEYYGRAGIGLKDHTAREHIIYYTPKDPPAGARTLKINIRHIRPEHFRGVTTFSDPQQEAMYAYYRAFGNQWIESVIVERPLQVEFAESTVAVLKRRLLSLLSLDFDGSAVHARGIFDIIAGETTVKDIVLCLEEGKLIIVDTSSFTGAVEILIGSLIASEAFFRYRAYKSTGQLDSMPALSIILEEAPRVLGKEVLEAGPNIFSTIAREGRKFNIGLCAITQLPSLIPRQILANMNTKIILGTEMKAERQAIIESAVHDLSEDDRTIASLDKGEAIITSTFTRFAIPVKIPLFEELVKQSRRELLPGSLPGSKQFPGISLS